MHNILVYFFSGNCLQNLRGMGFESFWYISNPRNLNNMFKLFYYIIAPRLAMVSSGMVD
jgi:hypothetical protein